MYPAEVDCGDDGDASCERGWDTVKGDKDEGLHLIVISGGKKEIMGKIRRRIF